MRTFLARTAFLSTLLFYSVIVNGQWVAQTSGTENDLNCVKFVDSNIGWAIGNNGTIIKTIDSGITWIAQTSNTLKNLYGLSFINTQTGYIAGESYRRLKTTNGGSVWSTMDWGTGDINSIHAFSSTTVIGVGNNLVIRTTDSFSDATKWGSFGIQNRLFYVGATGWMVGNSGKIYKLTGTITFTNQTSGTSEDLLGVHFVSTSVGYVVGKNGTILKTTNGGTNWGILASGVSVDLHSVFFTDANTGYAVGKNETILKTTDGGSNWTIQMSGTNTNQTHNFVWFTDANNGWIVGSNGAIYHTTNGGEATVGMATTPFGPNSRCETPAIYSTSAVNATSYLWTLEPVSSGSITGTGSTATVTWSSGYTGNSIITAQGQNASELGSISNTLIVYGNPEAFSLSSPANGIWVSATPLFQWAASTGAIHYDLYIDGALFKSSITSTSYQVLDNEALASGMHTWYVVASNGCTTQSNETRSFRVDASAPSAFSITTPTDDSWTSELKPTIEWSASNDAHSGLSKYQLWMNGALYSDNIAPNLTSIEVLQPLENMPYECEIWAIDGVGNIRKTEPITFTVDYLPPGGMDGFWTIADYGGPLAYGQAAENVTFTPQYTFECWIKPDGAPYSGNIRGIMQTTRMQLLLNEDNVLWYRSYYAGQQKFNILFSNYTVPNGEWTHIAIVHKKGESASLYVNGSLVQTASMNDTEINTSLEFRVGCSFYVTYTYFHRSFFGKIREVRLWEKARSSEEIAEFYNHIVEPNEPNLLAYWPMNSKGDGTTPDLTSRNNHLTLTNSTVLDPVSYQYQGYNYHLGNLAQLNHPKNYEYYKSNPSQFIWENAVDAGVGVDKYQVIIDNETVADGLTANSYAHEEALGYGSHYWYVNGYDKLGNNQTSTKRVFFIDNASPYRFSLIAPDNNGIEMFPTPSLTWEAVTDSLGGSGMRKYQLWIDGEVDRDSIPIGTTTASPSTALDQGAYTWFIKAYDKVGNVRQSSEVRTFYVDWEPPVDFQLTSPADNTTELQSRPTFSWEPSSDIGSGLLKYELCISGKEPIELPVNQTSLSLPFDLQNGDYSWFVKAYDKANAFTSSNTFNLTISAPIPGKASLPSGDPQVCINSLESEISTAGATDATAYVWSILPDNAGVISGTGLIASVEWNQEFAGAAEVSVKGKNGAGEGELSEPLIITVHPLTEGGNVLNDANICFGQATGTLSLVSYVGSILKWQKSLDEGLWVDIQNGASSYSEVPISVGNWKYRAEVKSGTCESAFSNSAQVSVGDKPMAAGSISGSVTVCQGASQVNYSIQAVEGATSYEWILPSGATGESTSNSIDVDFGLSAESGEIRVFPKNSCGSGETSALMLTVNPLPLQAGDISGDREVCIGQGSIVYSIEEIPNASTYQWSLPVGFNGSSSSNSINLTVDNNAQSGEIRVKGVNDCGVGLESSISIVVKRIPEEAGSIVGSSSVCQGEGSITYSIPPISNAVSYEWSLPNGFRGSSQTNSIVVDVELSASSGEISVQGVNSCGKGELSVLNVVVNPLPGNALGINGDESVCQGQGSVNYYVDPIENAMDYQWTLPEGVYGTIIQNGITLNFGPDAESGTITVVGSNSCGFGSSSSLEVVVNPLPSNAEAIQGETAVCVDGSSIIYSVPEISNATSYQWTLPSGAVGNSTTNSISVLFTNSSVSGAISVKGINQCGEGDGSELYVNVNSSPSSAGLISGNVNVCAGETNVRYTVQPIDKATSYMWTLPSGTTGVSSTNTIDVTFDANASSGDISVKGVNECGDGQRSNLQIVVNRLPDTPGIITGESSLCQGVGTVSYTIGEIGNAASYEWNLPDGVTGSSTSNSIDAEFGMNSVSGDITVRGVNNCGVGEKSRLVIEVNPKPVTPVISLAGNTLSSSATVGNQWYKQNSIVNGATNQSYVVEESGEYHTVVTLLGCSSDPSNAINVTLSSTGFTGYIGTAKLYPNPFSALLNIEVAGNENFVSFEILNSMGQVVYAGSVKERTTVSTTSFSPGVYIVKFSIGKETVRVKVVKD